jgi:hypothetical protein
MALTKYALLTKIKDAELEVGPVVGAVEAVEAEVVGEGSEVDADDWADG